MNCSLTATDGVADVVIDMVVSLRSMSHNV
jgi:hypothetical protein